VPSDQHFAHSVVRNRSHELHALVQLTPLAHLLEKQLLRTVPTNYKVYIVHLMHQLGLGLGLGLVGHCLPSRKRKELLSQAGRFLCDRQGD
jgi:hypothetical protein